MPNLYKSVLDALPTAAIVTDKNLKVRYTNRAFREYFPDSLGRGSLKNAIGCKEKGECGRAENCAYCPLRNLFLDAKENGGLSFRKIMLKNEDKDVPLSMKVRPLGKYYLGVVDNAYESEIAREMYSAQNIQQRLLPPARSGKASYAFLFEPCREIGGDLPDVYEVQGDTMGVLADVSGKGISAGMLSAFVKAGWDRSEPSPARALTGLNAKFQELNLDERSYVTAVAARIVREEGKIIYSSAGHNAPILHKSVAGIDEIEMNAPPVSTWMPDYCYQEGTIDYRKGDLLVMVTDGVTESRNAKGEQFTINRVEEVLQKSSNAEDFIARLKGALADFCESFDDDITAIAFDL